MNRVSSLRVLLVAFLVLGALLAACAPAAAPAPQPTQPPPAPTQAPPTQVPPTQAPPPTKAPPPPTAIELPPTAVPQPETLRLATTTSTADSGLLDFILPSFEKANNAKVDVVAVGSGQAIEIGSKGDADVLLVHSRKAEDKFVTDGFAKKRDDVMYNDFIIVGPKADPAKIKGMATGKEAFKAIMDSKSPFASRGDKSGTNTKELSIWSSLSITPTQEMKWYNSLGQGMGDTLLFSKEQGAYTLTDRGTYLSMVDKLPDLEILVGGQNLAENKDKALLNPYGVLAVNPEKWSTVNYALAMKFVDWLLSPETHKVIGGYGADKFGQPLFYPSMVSRPKLISPKCRAARIAWSPSQTHRRAQSCHASRPQQALGQGHHHDRAEVIARESPMLSARNQFEGVIKSITLGTVMAEVVVAVGDLEFVAAITRGSADALDLKVGDKVKAVVKATEVMVAKD
jgi:tungstate transport system substrate-binding protein